MGKVHHQIRLRILSCGRVSENHRGPEVPEVKVRVVECRDGFARINNSFCERWHPPECLFYKNKNGCRFGDKCSFAHRQVDAQQNKNGCRLGDMCSFAHRQVDAQPTKWSKSNNDKSAVAILKKENWQEREWVSDSCHDRTGKLVRRSGKKLGQNSYRNQFSDARQLGCVFQDMTPPKVYSPEVH